MNKEKTSFSFAPYNFIPFPEVEVPKPYPSSGKLPGHDESDKESFSGKIRFTVKALSEIAVGGKRSIKDEQNVNEFCRDVSGRFVIPGSTMRGFIRNHAEILGLAYPEYITDETYLYRKLAGKCKTVREEYNRELKADTEGGLRLPNGVKAGWIYKKGTSYYIQPVKEFGETGTTFFQIHERDLRQAENLITIPYMYKELISKFHLRNPRELNTELKSYNAKLKQKVNRDYKPYRGCSVRFDYDDGHIRNLGGKDAKYKGTVLNSAWMYGKTHHYLVSAEDSGDPFPVSKTQIADYKKDYERNCIQNSNLKTWSEFYALPNEEGTSKKKLFFYKMNTKENTKQLVGFGPTPYFRIFYKHNVKTGIPMHTQKKGYDYVQGIFGFVNSQDAYKGRVAFSDAVYIGSETITDREVVLLGPRGTAIQMYLKQRNKELDTYNTEGFKLRGYKFYWKRASVKTSDKGSKKKIVTILKTLPAGSMFQGEIWFDNLKKDELGLLLLSIRYADSKNQHESFMIGGGKPYGFGQIEIEDISLSLIDQASRYTSVNVDWKDAFDRITEFKSAYKDKLRCVFKIDLEKQESVNIYRAYAGIETADAYLKTSETVYMPVSRSGGDNKDVSVYADFHPLKEAKDIVIDIDSKHTSLGNRMTKLEAGSRKTTGVKYYERKNGAVWIGGYPLPEEQRLKIERNGIKVFESVIKWPDSRLIEIYAEKYDTVLLASRVSSTIEQQAKARFSRVYRATKSGRFDDGWKPLKV